MAEKKMFKKLLIIGAVVAIVIIVAVALLVSNLSSVARQATEKALSHILQVNVSVGGMNVSLAKGTVEINKIVIGNPEGFKTKEAVSLERIFVQADLKSFASDQPVVNEISVNGAKVTLEQGLTKSNLGTLVNNASRFSGAPSEGEGAATEEQEASKSIVIDKLVLEGGHVALSSPVLQGKEVSFPLPRIEETGIGRGEEKVTIAEAVQMLISDILGAAVKSGGDLIPEDFSKMLGGTLDTVGKTGESVGEGLKETGESVGDSLKGAAEGIGGLFKKQD